MKRSVLAFSALIVTAAAGIVIAHSSGPQDGRTNAPGESNCTGCHSQYALNSGSGALALSLPNTYKPGDTLSGTVSLNHSGQQRWGFEVTVLDSANQPIGHLLLSDSLRTQLSVAGSGREYVKQTSDGTDYGVFDSTPGWIFLWIAPDTGAGPATFYAAGNAANGFSNTAGDYIYTTVESVAVSPPTCCFGMRGNIDGGPEDLPDISDIIYLVEYSFGGGPAPACAEEADVNGDAGTDIGDLTYLVEYSFGGGPPPLVCPGK